MIFGTLKLSKLLFDFKDVMKLHNHYSKILFALLLLNAASSLAIPFTNLFDPYDILLVKPFNKNRCFDFYVATEGALNTRAFQADPDDMINLYNEVYPDRTKSEAQFSRNVEVLKIWQPSQNIFNSLHPQQFVEKDLVEVHGQLSIPANMMFAAHCSLPWDIMIGVYLPLYVVSLKNVRWDEPKNPDLQQKVSQQLGNLEQAGKFSLHDDWQQVGIGDLAALVWWARGFPQAKRWLKLVNVNARGGLTFPTGKDANLNNIFGLPLGNNAGVGFLMGGNIELGLFDHLKFGLDAEFLQLLGSRKTRRFKHQPYETDLVFTEPFGDLYLEQVSHYPEAQTFSDPGFLQHYTIYMAGYDLCGAAVTLAYQHKRQHETTYMLNTANVNPQIVDIAESLQDWTMHNIVCMVDYAHEFKSVTPTFTAFIKYGFNGKRVISCNTVGAQISLDF